jgi:hypothetical protein
MAVATTEKRPRTPAQIAHAQRLAQLAKERAAMPPPAPAEASVEATVLDPPDDVFQQLVQLAQAAGGMAKKKQDRTVILDQVASLLNKLDPAAYAEILAHPAVEKLTGEVLRVKEQDGEVLPGSSLGQAIGKKPWTWRDLAEDKMEWVTYTPRRTVPVTYNGLTYYFHEDLTVRVPKCFVDIEEESRRNNRLAKEHQDYMFRKRDSVSDPGLLAGGSMSGPGKVRGMFSGGLVSGSWHEVPDHDRPGIDAGAEGEGEEGAA